MSCFAQSQWAPDSLGAVINATKAMRIDHMDVRNDDGSAQTLAVHIVGAGDDPTVDNHTIRVLVTLQPGETQTLHAINGNDLDQGDAIYLLASLASAVSYRISGRFV